MRQQGNHCEQSQAGVPAAAMQPGHVSWLAAHGPYEHRFRHGSCDGTAPLHARAHWPACPRQCGAHAASICCHRSPSDGAPWGMQHYLDGTGRWGVMEEGRWKAFLEWLEESGLLKDTVRLRVAACDSRMSGSVNFIAQLMNPGPRKSLELARKALAPAALVLADMHNVEVQNVCRVIRSFMPVRLPHAPSESEEAKACQA